MADEPITEWLHLFKEGDAQALQPLWERYFRQLVQLANKKLLPGLQPSLDGEDVALSAFHSFVQGVGKNRFPQLEDRNNLWALLVVITARKAHEANARALCKKRGEGKVRGESAFLPTNPEEQSPGIQAVIGKDPTPDQAVEIAETCQRLLDALPDERYRQIAILKMQGHTVAEIVDKLQSTQRTVERGLNIIRAEWLSAFEARLGSDSE